MWKVLVVVLCVTQGSASCPEHCRCPPRGPTCAAGVGLMPDSCGCCTVCARQLFQDCSTTRPCDHTKGLECNFGGGLGSAEGICRAKSDGRTCEYNNKIYQNGEIFRPNCKHQCTCMDGAVGCGSLCQHQLSLPKVGCAKPRRVKVPGRCCEPPVCLEESQSSFGEKHRNEGGKDRASEDDLTARNELTEPLAAFKSQPMGHVVAKCVSETTAWSPCSKSCGPGESSRMNNSNAQCKLRRETRVCEIRPCKPRALGTSKKRRKCSPAAKAVRAVKLSHAGCRSLKKFQPRYCGSCADGRCCRPHRTQTLPVRFACQTGETFSRRVMMIESCKCSYNCSGGSKSAELLSDIHYLKM